MFLAHGIKTEWGLKAKNHFYGVPAGDEGQGQGKPAQSIFRILIFFGSARERVVEGYAKLHTDKGECRNMGSAGGPETYLAALSVAFYFAFLAFYFACRRNSVENMGWNMVPTLSDNRNSLL